MSLPSRLPPAKPDDLSPPTTPFSEPSLEELRRGYARAADGALVKRHIPTPTQMAQIKTHIAKLKFRLDCAASRRETGVEIARLLAAFPAQAQSDVPADLRVDAYFEALDGVPLWAIAEARQRVIRGEADLDTRFAPTPPQFAAVAREATEPARIDLASLEAILARVEQPEPDPEERQRVASGFAKLQVDILKRTGALI